MNFHTARLYGVLLLAGIMASAWAWSRVNGGSERRDHRLTFLYFWGLGGALIGAKLSFLLAGGWAYRDDWIALLSGRSITGGLLGGYAAVEIGKRRMQYKRPTGDAFAIVVPLGLMFGRIGCMLRGCCPGVPCAAGWWASIDASGVARWPAASAEFLFNALFLAWALLAVRKRWCRGNCFHVYLMAYGLFRGLHEFLRVEPRWFGPLTGYHFLSAALFLFGALRYHQRKHKPAPSEAGRE